jgi:replicative DNA helicase Mcm
MYKSVVKLGKEGNIHDIIIEIISVQDLEKKNDVCMTEEEIDKLKKASKEKDFTDKLTNSFAPLIIGYEDIKFSILLMLAGGYSTVKRNDINILLVGDPSLAKSELLKECSKISNKSMYTSGRGASAAGLTIGIVKMENGTQVAQAGVLPLCNEGHACIDEFDKMNPDDRSAMHEGMEQQTVSIAKAGFRMTLPAKASILAAANPKYGKYDIESSLIDNINIPVPLVSRFDLIWLIRDVVNVDEDSRKAQHVLDTFTGNDMSGTTYLSRNELTSYLNYIREYKPIITLEAKKKLAEIYKTMRQLSVSNDSLAIGVRQLEALARLATAHAKILFKDKVEVSDVLIVEELLKRMFGSLGVNTDNKFSQATFVVGKKENKEQSAHSVWSECMNEKGNVMYESFIKKLGESPLFDENSAKKLFGNWEQQCVIKLNGDGTYRKL